MHNTGMPPKSALAADETQKTCMLYAIVSLYTGADT